MKKTFLNIVIVLVIIFSSGIIPSSFMKDIWSYVPNILTVSEVVEITAPKEEYLTATKDIAKEILENVDTKKAVEIAVFSDEFATKIESYKDQKVESSYLISMFKSSYKKAFGEAGNFSKSDSVSNYIKSNIFSKEKFVTNEEIDALKEFFRGLAWNLVAKKQS